jgi:hypothetical protein
MANHNHFEYQAAPIATPLHSSRETFQDYDPEEYWEEPGYASLPPVQQRIVIMFVALVVVIPLTIYLLSRLTVDNDVVTRPVAPIAAAAVVPEPVNPGPGTGGGATSGQLSPVFTREIRHWEENILNWSAQYDLDPNLTAIIMQVESCGDPNAVSSAGAQGLFQVMPFHFTSGENMQDPDTNARRGLNYFTEGLRMTNGNVGLSYAGYNGGHGTAAKNQSVWPNETQRYYTWTTGIYADIQAGLTESPTLQRWLQAGGSVLCQQAANRLGLSG